MNYSASRRFSQDHPLMQFLPPSEETELLSSRLWAPRQEISAITPADSVEAGSGPSLLLTDLEQVLEKVCYAGFRESRDYEASDQTVEQINHFA